MRPPSDRNYDDPNYITWRKAVYTRDGFRCQMPGCNPRGRKVLHAHHIQRWADNPTLRFVVNNGITLCKTCHKKVTANEESYQALFSGIAMKNGNRGDKAAGDFQLRLLMSRYGKA